MFSIFYKKIFEEKWPSELGGVLLALLNTLLFLHSGPIAATNAVIADWGRWIYNVALLNLQSPVYFLQTSRYFPQSIMYIGLMLGVFLSALLAKQFSIKRDKTGGYIQGFIGGALMGIGSFLAGACILGGLFSDIMGLSLSGFVMMAGLLAGAYIGGIFVMWQINRQAEKLFNPDHCEVKTASKDYIVKKDYRGIQPKIAITVALLLLAIISIDKLTGTGFPSAALLSGILFGIIFQRSAFCFVAAFREIFLTGTTRMMRSLIISLLIGAAGFSIIMAAGLRPTEVYIFHTSGRLLLGSVIFGFGMTITGG
ncbi:MAG: YeeE/YedE family protein [Nitrospirae bacterium]|nr:YeeE/YedE family protein [Nitrospirota bacterium]